MSGIGRWMPDDIPTEAANTGQDWSLRAFVDGQPSPKMMRARAETISRLRPIAPGWASEDGRICLCEGAFESGYDCAIIASRDVIDELVDAANDALAAAWHSEAYVKNTWRRRLEVAVTKAKGPRHE